MKSLWLPTLALMVFMAISPPAFAQDAGTDQPSPGTYSWGPYVVTGDGILFYDDIGAECNELAELGGLWGSWSGESPPPDPLTTVESVELCTEAGFPPPGIEAAVEDLAADEEDRLVGPRPKEYEVMEDSTLVIDGNVYANDYCRLFAEDSDLIDKEREDYAEACVRAGFPPPGSEGAALPETGGTPITAFIGAASVLAGSILMLMVVRRSGPNF